jgi:hypothetical protein
VGVAVLALGCSTTSTITRVNGPPVEADIVGGSRDTIFVRSESGAEFEIRRRDVTDIDYPGNVHAIVGAGVLGYGIVNMVVGLPNCSSQSKYDVAYCTGVVLPAVLGAVIMTWGLVTNLDAQAAADDRSWRSRLPGPPRNGAETVAHAQVSEPAPRPKRVAPLPIYLEDDPPKIELEEEPWPPVESAKPAQTAPPSPAPPPRAAPTVSPATAPPPPPPPSASPAPPTKAFPVDP